MSITIRTDHERDLDRAELARPLTGDELDLLRMTYDWRELGCPRAGKVYDELMAQIDLCADDAAVRRAELSAQMSEERAELGCREREAAE
jgi:hypothetical protein